MGVYIKDLSAYVVNNADDMDRIMTLGHKNRECAVLPWWDACLRAGRECAVLPWWDACLNAGPEADKMAFAL